MIPKVIAVMSMSVDGYVADPDDGPGHYGKPVSHWPTPLTRYP